MQGRRDGGEDCVRDDYQTHGRGWPAIALKQVPKTTNVVPSPSRETTESEVKAPEMEFPMSQQLTPVQSECPELSHKELPLL